MYKVQIFDASLDLAKYEGLTHDLKLCGSFYLALIGGLDLCAAGVVIFIVSVKFQLLVSNGPQSQRCFLWSQLPSKERTEIPKMSYTKLHETSDYQISDLA